MSEVTLMDVLTPWLNVMGGVAGLTVLYFVVVLWQGKKKLQRLERIEREQLRARERDIQVFRSQRLIMKELNRLNNKLRR